MALYRERVLPHLVDLACGSPALGRWRAEVAAGLAGTVVEVGFGSGLNLGHYPPEVARILAVEPAATARRIAARRIAAARVPVEHVGLDGHSLGLDDASCDAALSTFTLCTLRDPMAALAELRRVLRTGGKLHALEHGLSPDPSVARWQHRLDPLQRKLADGCHLTRDPLAMLRDAGFLLERADQAYGAGPKPWTFFTLAVASSPAARGTPQGGPPG
ncbi:MAG: class I SAM-dependent methyltransferase [Actinomycetota bacterium]|nr:class I SAM-dependent methyltransferase [Actinomycetota bacterium]